MTRFHARIEAAAPERRAILGTGVALTYAALGTRARRMAGWLHRQGVAPGDMLGLTIREDLAHLVVALALLRLGCGQVTFASHDPPPLRAALAARLRPVAVIGDGAADALPGLPLILPDHASIAGDAALERSLPEATPQGTVVLASSGTTGRPKLIPLTEAALLAQASHRAGQGALRHRPVGAEHNNGKRFAFFALANGDALLLAEASRIAGPEAACRDHGADLLAISPHQAEGLLAAARRAPWPARTRIDLSGSAPGDGLVARLQAGLTPEVHLLYGTTEVGSIARAGPAEIAARPGSAGQLLPGAEVQVVDDRGRPLPAGETGVLRLRSAGMAEGYLDDPEATARAFGDGWFRPGDMGRIGADGMLFVAGRADDMMILGSLNIFPAEIEAAAAGFPGLAECAAFPLRSAALGEIPALAAVAEPGCNLDAAALLAHCRARLGMRAPRKVVLLAELPRNRAGKVLRRDLAAMAEGPGD
jgi:acyl-CoA synthetase (AMP-forming)/AMP-acid ligase II